MLLQDGEMMVQVNKAGCIGHKWAKHCRNQEGKVSESTSRTWLGTEDESNCWNDKSNKLLCMGRRVQVVQYQLIVINWYLTPTIQCLMIYTQLNKPYISLFMIVGGYHGLNTSSGLLKALLILHWDACVFILSNIESSHMLAGHLWALEPKAM